MGRPKGTQTALPRAFHSALEEFVFNLSLVRAASANTVQAYVGDLRRLFAHLAGSGLAGPSQVREDHLRAYLIELHEAGREASTVARVRSAVRTFFAFLTDEGVVVQDPSHALKAPRGWKRVPPALSVEEARALMESAQGEKPLELRDRALLEMAYGTGARVSEMLGLVLEDVAWDERIARLLGKGSRTRLVPLGRPAMRALRAYTEKARPVLLTRHRGSRLPRQVFLNARGGRLSRMGFWKILRKRATGAGLGRRVHPHLLRHTYATHLLHGGASLRVVQELLGHARLASTQIYTGVDEPYLQDAHQRYHPRG